MKCFYCNQEIHKYKEEYELFGCDGDFIHKKCRPFINEEMNRLATMSDKEFYNWMGVEYSDRI